MKFTKMHGAGNDYIYINCFEEKVENPEQLSIKLSNRHFGIGSDGLVLILPSEKADCQMRMFNADGSEGEMCGNAIRCIGKYVYDHGIVSKTQISVDTKGGIKYLELYLENQKVSSVKVDMGIPVLDSELPEAIEINDESLTFVGVDMGCPHAVYFVDDVNSLDLETVGSYYENHSRFPNRVNSDFVQIVTGKYVKMRVWERGSGETLACGTGASATAVACILMGYTERTVEVELLGGILSITWDEESDHLYMTGPAVEVYHGEIEI